MGEDRREKLSRSHTPQRRDIQHLRSSSELSDGLVLVSDPVVDDPRRAFERGGFHSAEGEEDFA